VAALERALSEIERYDWLVLTSANGVRSVSQRLEGLELTHREVTDQLQRVSQCSGPRPSCSPPSWRLAGAALAARVVNRG
jgi:hypothetical protein